MTTDEFVQRFGPLALEIQQTYGIPASAILALHISEVGRGGVEVTNGHRNYFGIHCTSNEPCWDTGIATDPHLRQYNTDREAYVDFAKFLYDNPRYGYTLTALKATGGDPYNFFVNLANAGYVLGPNAPLADRMLWANKLGRLVDEVRTSPAFADIASGRFEETQISSPEAPSQPAEPGTYVSPNITGQVENPNSIFFAPLKAIGDLASLIANGLQKPWRLIFYALSTILMLLGVIILAQGMIKTTAVTTIKGVMA